MSKRGEQIIGIGYGTLKNQGHDLKYHLNANIDKDEEVVLVRKSDLEKIAQSKTSAITLFPFEMDEIFYNPEWLAAINSCSECSFLPDEIVINQKSTKEIFKLFLDRQFYTTNPKKYLIAFWKSVDQAEQDEFPLDPDNIIITQDKFINKKRSDN